MNQYTEKKISNEKLLFDEIRAKKTILTALPPRLTFEIDWSCNYVCKKCCYSSLSNSQGFTAVNRPSWEQSDIERISDELFPTLRYTESTLLGEPFLYRHYPWLMDLYRKYGVYYRPTTNGSLITEAKIEKANGVIDWLKCSFDAHNRELYHRLYLKDNFNRVVENLKMFSKYRDQMNPRPWFRVGLVLMRSNLDHLTDYVKFCHEELGVDDVEIMALNYANPFMAHEFYFDKLPEVENKLHKLATYCNHHHYRLRLPWGHYQQVRVLTFPDRRMSDAVRDGDIFGNREQFEQCYVWSNNERISEIRADDGSMIGVCEYWTRLFLKPPTIENGEDYLKVESCGSCSTYCFGNLKKQSFREIYNNDLNQKVRSFMYLKPSKSKVEWPTPCRKCLCIKPEYSYKNNGPENVGKRYFQGDNIYE